MSFKKIIIISWVLLLVSGCANNQYNPKKLPKELKINSTVQVPNPTALGIYIPSVYTTSFYYDRYSSRSVEYGKALQQGMFEVSQVFFTDVTFKDHNPNKQFGLFLDVQPKWDLKAGQVGLTFDYQVLNTEFEVVLTGSQSYSQSLNYQVPENTFYNTSVRTSQKMFVDIANKLLREQKQFEATAKIADIPNEMLANLDKPISTAAAFKVNNQGHLVTSLSELNQCLVTKVEDNGVLSDVSMVDNSWLLDLAILKSPTKSEEFLTFSAEPIKVGTSMTTLSYQQSSDNNSSAPLLSFGHILSNEGISGSLGVYQFSTSTAPESKGAPILNANGNIIGMFTGDYNTKYLAEQEVIPKNNQFAMKNEHLLKFLEVKGIPFTISKSEQEVDVTATAMAHTVKLNCYQ